MTPGTLGMVDIITNGVIQKQFDQRITDPSALFTVPMDVKDQTLFISSPSPLLEKPFISVATDKLSATAVNSLEELTSEGAMKI